MVRQVSRSSTRPPGREQDAEVDAVDDFVIVEVRETIIDLALTPEDEERAEVAAVRDAVLVEVGRAWIGRKITVVARRRDAVVPGVSPGSIDLIRHVLAQGAVRQRRAAGPPAPQVTLASYVPT